MGEMRRNHPALICVLLGILSACDQGKLETSRRELTPQESVFIALEPIHLRPSESDRLGMVSGLAFWGTNIAVPDGIQQNVKIFDAKGTLVQTIGRAGDGPGEFRGPSGAAAIKGGQLAVIDGMKRVTLFAPDGVYLRHWRAGVILSGNFRASQDSTRIIVGGMGNVEDDGAPAMRAALLYNVDGHLQSSLGQVPDSLRPGEYNFLAGYGAEQDGVLAAMLKAHNRVHIRTRNGDTTFLVGNAIWEPPAWDRLPLNDLGAHMKWTNTQMWTNRLLPAGGGAFVAALSRFDTVADLPRAHYVFFDPSGNELTVTTAANFLIQEIRRDTAYYLRTHPDGSVWLERYRIRLPAGAEPKPSR